MKALIDTNVILEHIMQRERVAVTNKLFKQLEMSGCELYMSVGGFYTMIFVIEKILRREYDIKGDENLKLLRILMSQILQMFKVAEHKDATLFYAITDPEYKDLEDSCQYQLAVAQGCDCLITFNTADYPVNDKASVKVLSPESFTANRG